MLDKITPLILTFNEELNIQRSLEKLGWAKKIVVVDSGSTDRTIEFLKRDPRVQIFYRKFDFVSSQFNYGVQQISTPWVLALDADYVLSDELIKEVRQLNDDFEVGVYLISFRYCVFGKPLRETLLPIRKVLHRKQGAIYKQDGHSFTLDVPGYEKKLLNKIDHDDRKPFERWLDAQGKYVELECIKLRQEPFNQLSLPDKIRKLGVFAPCLIGVYCLIFRGLIWDGWRGWYYVFQRIFAELLLSLKVIESKFPEPMKDGKANWMNKLK